MKSRLITLLFASTSAILAITQRPPIPADVPFEYDPNMVTSEILMWYVAEPNLNFIFTAKVKNKWGLQVDFIVSDCYDANTPILVERGLKTKDLEHGGWIQEFNVVATPGAEGVHYIEMTATDKIGRFDKRTLLVLCVEDEPPFIFIDDPPIIASRKKEAQRIWQVATKQQYPVTKPTKVMN